MPRRKAEAAVFVGDGAGGMTPISDLRFSDGEWPIELVVPSSVAQTWMAHLGAEIEERGWNSTGLSQMEAVENSGTLTVRTESGQSPPAFDIVWERPRGEDLRLRARPSGQPELPLEVVRGFIDAVQERQRAGRKERAHRRDMLTYSGLPWRGEVWLSDELRLGPPSKFPEALIGPQIVIVDVMAEGIGHQGVSARSQERLRDVRVFLGFVLGLNLQPVRVSSDWVCEVGPDGLITDCVLRPIGYVELAPSPGFPVPGSIRPAERRPVTRPGLGPSGLWPDMVEEWVPDDIEALWDAFQQLPEPDHDQLMRAGNAYAIAQTMWPDQRTAYATFLVIACEALKPGGRRHQRKNIYNVVAALLGAKASSHLSGLVPKPQTLRSRHVHMGELVGGELLPMLMSDYFADPSFDEMIQALSQVTRMCLIEWLRKAARKP